MSGPTRSGAGQGGVPAAPPVKRPKHLLDPANPQRRPSPRRSVAVERVQMWVLSSLAVVSILHFAGGLVLASFYVDESRPDAQIGLLVLGAVSGVLGVAAGRAIHRSRLLSWWLLLGLVPSLVGAYLMYVA